MSAFETVVEPVIAAPFNKKVPSLPLSALTVTEDKVSPSSSVKLKSSAANV